MANAQPPQTPRRPFQFSLASLMILITVTAVVLGLSAAIAGAVVHYLFGLVVLYIYPAGLVACVAYGRGDFQAFALGAFVPCVRLIGAASGPFSVTDGLTTLISLLITGGICGIVAMLTRRWILANNAA